MTGSVLSREVGQQRQVVAQAPRDQEIAPHVLAAGGAHPADQLRIAEQMPDAKTTRSSRTSSRDALLAGDATGSSMSSDRCRPMHPRSPPRSAAVAPLRAAAENKDPATSRHCGPVKLAS